MAKEVKSTYNAIGVMAGSSMDGLDVALMSFAKGLDWSFEILRAKSFSYDQSIYDLLAGAADNDLKEQTRIDLLFGEWIARKLLEFGVDEAELVAVHGHTVIHKPKEGISWQLGSGKVIAEMTNATVISDFRTEDVNLGGQGAPLVPVGDFQLFSSFDGCLNLGGIANVSIQKNGMAWDICPCNQVLNFFAQKLGKEFDKNGEMARAGIDDSSWLEEIASNKYYDQQPPKSLPNQFIGRKLLDEVSPHGGLRTYTEFISNVAVGEISKFLPSGSRIFTTGGGAFNTFLLEKLNSNKKGLVFSVPDSLIVEYKEAVVFGFLGVLKLLNKVNVLASVTGASRDTSSGIIHYSK
ncbi:MAG: anhydro-N-acetylmuramic acid kinase [Cyclobacteriaceae bacterium]